MRKSIEMQMSIIANVLPKIIFYICVVQMKMKNTSN